MRQLHRSVILCFLIVNSWGLPHSFAVEKNQVIVCEHDQGPCKLRDLREITLGPYQHGLRLWFGSQLTVKCSFHAFTHRDYPQLTWIDSSSIAVNESSAKPRFYAHHVAFLAADESLIACCGDSLMSEPTSTRTEGRSLVMQIPRGYHPEIALYKTAYYESEAAIGTQEANHQPSRDEIDSRDLRAVKNPLRINARHRQLFANLPKGMHAYTVEGVCNVGKSPLPSKGDEAEVPPVSIGSKLSSQANIFFRVTDDKGLVIYYSIKNNSESTARQDVYIAFFDDDGRLIASTSLKCSIAPGAVSPSVSIDGVPQANASALSAFLPMLLPKGHHKSITNFKMTMYVYHIEPED